MEWSFGFLWVFRDQEGTWAWVVFFRSTSQSGSKNVEFKRVNFVFPWVFWCGCHRVFVGGYFGFGGDLELVYVEWVYGELTSPRAGELTSSRAECGVGSVC